MITLKIFLTSLMEFILMEKKTKFSLFCWWVFSRIIIFVEMDVEIFIEVKHEIIKICLFSNFNILFNQLSAKSVLMMALSLFY